MKKFVIVFFMIAFWSTSYAVVTQGNWRWYEDDGAEGAATAMAAENTAITIGPEQKIRLRLELAKPQSGSEVSLLNLSLYYSTNSPDPYPSGGTWTPLGPGKAFDYFNSSYVVSNTPTSADILSDLAGTTHHSGGLFIENTSGVALTATQYVSYEYEFTIQATSAATNGLTYYFALHEDSDYLDAYVSPTPHVTFDESLPVTLASFSAQQEGNAVLLKWRTSSEVDHQGFIVERQAAGSAWQKLDSYITNPDLCAKGNTTSGASYQYIDNDITTGDQLSYRICDVDVNGVTVMHDAVNVAVQDVAVPDQTALLPAYPNPFNPETRIQYQLADDATVSLSVVDLLGRTVRTILADTRQSAGNYTQQWDGRDDRGAPLASGVYMIILHAGQQNMMQKVTLVR